ncbi:partition protein A [Phenylobacterium zucineum HLK1]|uniref:Partition protein A n=1 Tax=Phenylobacterium zucineum (strain HLK1) TaxID=450851 RepID=B4RCT7_PHEZH|nr:ParA family protein [Phenylobacterium zucineum]ACG78274.1 partition protein A [Phenylobacterium zucineum HLK1]
MPNVVFISPKGGAGKTTAAVALALGLVERGQRVAMIDADPNKPLVRWAELPNRCEGISVHPAPTVPDIRDAAREAQRRAPDWILLDTEGTERGAVVLAALRPDLVLTPLAGSQLDLAEAIKAAEMVRAFGRRGGREVPHRALLTRVPAAIKPKMLRSVVEQLRAAGVKILPTPLLEKEAFRALFHIGAGFEALEMNGVFGAAAARQNTAAYVADVTALVGPAEPGARAPAAEARAF